MASNNSVDIKVRFNADVSNFQTQLQTIQNGLNKLNVPTKLYDSLRKNITTIETEIEKITSKTADGYLHLIDEKSVNDSTRKIISNFAQIEQKLGSKAFSQLKLNVNYSALDQANKKVENYAKSLQKVQEEVDDLKNKQATLNATAANPKSIAHQEDIFNKREADLLKARQELERYQKQAEQKYSDKGTDPKKTYKVDENGVFSYKNMSKDAQELQQKVQKAAEEVQKLQGKYEGAKNKLEDMRKKQEDYTNEIPRAEANLQKIKDDFVNLKKELQGLNLKDTLGNNIDISNVANFDELKQKLNEVDLESATAAQDVIRNLQQAGVIGSEAVNDLSKSLDTSRQQLKRMSETDQDIQRLYNQLTQFFSISSAVQLFRRTVNSAIDAIKELDAAMTEVAVVTDFSVGDMWDQLPEYTAKANELGLAISDVYDASALYYQQGLDTAEVNSMVTSTLQMARIAGLDAAVATDRMTNAMRGFNMEINQANASHVADVYSNLAAKSASNVDELSTAMTKTASIAASANMQFENVAAFLAQGIETTRESA